MAPREVRIGGVSVGGEKLAVIAGPCAVESEEVVFKAAETVAAIRDKFKLPAVFKSSYMKANRLSGESFSTIGIGRALSILQDVKGKFKLPILTDVHTVDEIELVVDIADCLQIPAFLCRVNIKKGQFLAPEDMKPISDKVVSAGNQKVLLTERGTSFGYRDLVVDFRGIVIMKEFGFPVVFDCTHLRRRSPLHRSPGASRSGGGRRRPFHRDPPRSTQRPLRQTMPDPH
jgi:2-dehydro-3-deoxyphosphooctonate aldolase (KDO 8-P synthase)